MRTAFCFDLDGTITDQEILPLISREVGLYEEINLLTRITLDGLIPFQSSFKLRVRLLATIPLERVEAIVADVRINQDILGFILANKANCYVVTGNLDVWINALIKDKIGCNYFSSKANVNEGTLVGIEHILNKSFAVDQLRNKYDRIVAIGDSMNDCSMLQSADIGISYGGTHDPVNSLIKLSDYVVYDSRSLVNLLNNLNQ